MTRVKDRENNNNNSNNKLTTKERGGGKIRKVGKAEWPLFNHQEAEIIH